MITHDWLIHNGFTHHSHMRLESYTKNDVTYVSDSKDSIALRIQNVIYQSPVLTQESFIALHSIISGTSKLNFK